MEGEITALLQDRITCFHTRETLPPLGRRQQLLNTIPPLSSSPPPTMLYGFSAALEVLPPFPEENMSGAGEGLVA